MVFLEVHPDSSCAVVTPVCQSYFVADRTLLLLL